MLQRKDFKMNKQAMFILGLGVLLLISLTVISAYSRYVPAYTYGHQTGDILGTGGFPVFDRSMCEAGQDFLLQIDPLGCINSPVRSDLLEEQEVAVFCPVYATQLNPLIDVEDLDNVVIRLQDRPEGVLTAGFYPARAALGTGRGAKELTTPILGNIGYAVVVLKQQPNESAMPDFVEGNLTAIMKYDIKNAFGSGRNVFYLPEMTDIEFDRSYRAYSFWDGKGYLRLESADEEEATIGIYSDRDVSGRGLAGEKTRVSLVTLKKDKPSSEIYIPGFDYCLGRVRLRLQDIENPDTVARLRIDSDVIEVKKGEKFLENRCTLRDVEKQGLVQQADVRCKEDEGRNKDFTLTINPRIELSIGEDTEEVGIGDFLYKNGDQYVYLGFMGSDSDLSESEEHLYVRLLSIPAEQGGNKPKLSEEEISYMAAYDKAFHHSDIDKGVLVATGDFLLKSGVRLFNRVRQFFTGKKVAFVKYTDEGGREVFGKNVKILGYTGNYDADVPDSGNVKEYYGSAVEDYETVAGSFASDIYPSNAGETLGEQALREEILLSFQLSQYSLVRELCDSFEENYGIPPEVCTNAYLLANTQTSGQNVVIDGRTHVIAFERVREPSFEEFGATIIVDGIPRDLSKEEILYLNDETNEFIQLVDLDQDSATLRINLNRADKSALDTVSDAIFRDTRVALNMDEIKSFDSRYSFSLSKVNLERSASIVVEPEVDYVRGNATFNFKIGIDKRDIQLSPEKTQSRIDSLNSTLKKFQSVSDKLGKVVEIGKTACLATGAALTIKNFFANIGGKGIARSIVMREDGVGWYDRCRAEVNNGRYTDIEKCLLDNSDEIDASVNEYEEAIGEQESISSDGINAGYRSGISSDLQGVISKVRVGNEDVDVGKIISVIGEDTTSLSQARDLQLNARLLSSSDADTKAIAESKVREILGEIYSNSEIERSIGVVSNAVSDIGLTDVDFFTTENSVSAVYRGETTSKSLGEIPLGASAKPIIYNNEEYIVELEDVGNGKYRVVEIYDLFGNRVDPSVSPEYNQIKQRIRFEKYDATTYQKRYQNPEVRYYETDPYKGLPSVVPFDLRNGWYAAVKSTLPVLGGLQAYDASGRVTSFYVCNVGDNGREEFIGGDDICRGFVPGTGQSPDFPGLDIGESQRKMDQAVSAIEQASRAYRSGVSRITVDGQAIKVGEPAFNLPDIQCEDFMSPGDCNLLFNICDPVVCPSSRCDLGGAYPVKDVVQSGIAGSIALCLPNWPEVKVPICVSGVHAGLQGWISVLDSYQQCLQTSLDTGQTVGICDELNSVYMCEFMWRQGLPIVKYAIPQVLGKVFGQGSDGGGEYLAVQDAWDNAEQSVNYFTQYYAANSYKAFKARSADEVGGEVCKKFISLTTPDGGGLLDALTEPDSPPQFYGRFDEIVVQTVTNPPSSQYKVFYHIYAGTDFPAYYQVYLRGTGGSFYQDASSRRIVDTGFIAAGEYTTDTKDFTAPSGYQELCIVVNGQEECGFKQVTTEFGLNYLTESYVASEVKNTDIKSEKECVSGNPNVYSLLNPVSVVQATSADSAISSATSVGSELSNPAIYNRGIIRVCSTYNPGQGTDASIGTEGARWQDVGNCGSENLRCWLDTESVKDTIRNSNIEDSALGEVSEQYQEKLFSEGDYLSDDAFVALDKQINEDLSEEPLKIIELVGKYIDKVFKNNQKGYLYFLRGNAYRDLTSAAYASYLEGKKTETNEIITDAITAGGEQIREIANIGEEGGLPVFYFEDGIGGSQDLYYSFSGDEWYWNVRKDNNWVPVNFAPYSVNEPEGASPSDITSVKSYADRFEELADEPQQIIESMKDKGYSEGVQVLLARTVKNDGKGLFKFQSKLSAENVEFSPNKRFQVSLDGKRYWFEYSDLDDDWTWSFGGEYLRVSETEVQGNTLPEFASLIEDLQDKNFIEGAVRIFSGEVKIPGESGGTSEPSGETPTPTPTPTPEVCSGSSSSGRSVCRKILGEKIIEFAREAKDDSGISNIDQTVLQDVGAKNFECLALQVAWTESSILHCDDPIEVDGNPLYCNGDVTQLQSSPGDENSLGIMQINLGKHSEVDVADFDTNVKYGIGLLIDNYNPDPRTYRCYPQGDGGVVSVIYSGWNRSIRSYNGWNSECFQENGIDYRGNPFYVDSVTKASTSNNVKNLFQETCA